MASVPLDIKQKHNKLLVDLSDFIDADAPSWTNFIGVLHNAELPAGRLQRVKNKPLEVFHLMEERGILKEGDYSSLEETLEKSGNKQALDMVQKAGSEIKKQIKGQSSTPIGTKRTRAASDRSSSKKITKTATQGTSAASDVSHSNKKSKIELTDVGASSKDVYEVYDRKDKKGFLLILNFTENRDGAEHDVSKLRKFFEETLEFEVQDPRKDRDTDLSLSELNKVLENARDRLNKFSKRYYCFFCAILSHGNKKGILCGDRKHKPIDEIRKAFTNDKMENFVGKPKVFLIQACRGDNVQQGHDVADDWPEDISDVAGKMSVPTDADVLIAYATTPGNKAYRRPASGSWFIYVTINVFEERHKNDHVEEMFIKVKNDIAKDETWRTQNGELMMPCTWSTLTQKLMI